MIEQVEPSDIKSNLSNIVIIDISTGKNIPGGAPALNTARLECAVVLNWPQSQVVATNPVANSEIVTLDETKSILIVNYGNDR